VGADEKAVAEWVAAIEDVVEQHADELAAIIVEPVLQGTGGMYAYAPQCLTAMRKVADRYGLLLIADEIATGFGRTGALFACDLAGVVPDVMCLGKSLTGGYLSLAAVLCTSTVATAISESPQRALLHGPTFMANPLACTIASASIDLLQDCLPTVEAIGAGLTEALAPATTLSSVREVRTLGAVGVVQLNQSVDVAAVTRAALRRGVWVRPFRDLVYTMPPYISTPSDVAIIGSAIVGAVAEVHG
jgi:adenosylmethionine-8-amino-7-oxononanoate aminotransferase